MTTVDSLDAKILEALNTDPRATVIGLADKTGLSRNTVQARLAKLENQGVLQSFERRIDPAALGYPLTAYIMTSVTQRKLSQIAQSLDGVPEVVEVHGLSGVTDLLIHVVARDADDLYRIAGRVLDIDGVEKTTTALVMRQLIDYRLTPLLDQLTGQDGRSAVVGILPTARVSGRPSVSSLRRTTVGDCESSVAVLDWLLELATPEQCSHHAHHPPIPRMSGRSRRRRIRVLVDPVVRQPFSSRGFP